MDDGMRLPRPAEPLDVQTAEELAPTLEERLERGDRERLAEPARISLRKSEKSLLPVLIFFMATSI